MHTSTSPMSLQVSAHPPAVVHERPRTVARSREADAVARAQGGDQDAFSELYLQHKRRVFSVCMRFVSDFSLAEDLTQDTFLQVHRKLASFRGDSAFSTWLHRLAVNTVLMHLRKRVLAVASLDHLMESIPDQRAGRNFGTRDLAQAGVIDRLAIERALATIAPGYRKIFLLHDIHGYDHFEISTMLNCSCGNTKSQLHKARRVLRRALASQGAMAGRRSNYPKKDLPLQRRQTTR
ncbi:MAG TPA: RNA polymerase sigma factor [Terracidiphilus sp.]|nr:RNA polymerase sigma factor [Terracidiphilus sp.]